MPKKIVFSIFALTVLVFSLIMARAFRQTEQNRDTRKKETNVVVYAPSSFVNSYGPGADLKSEFEKSCECTIEYVDVGGGAMAIERMRLDPSRRVDVVVGLDHLLLAHAAESVKFQELDKPQIHWRDEIKSLVYPRFVSYDWSPMGIVYREGELQKAANWQEAFAKFPPHSLSLEDPTLSTPGLEFLFWIFSTQKNFEDFFEQLKPLVMSYSPTWSAAYGLFKKNQAKGAFSYLTSLVYHWKEEKDRRYQFMVFDDGHPMQIEYAAVPEACWSCAIAKKYVEFLVSPSAQKILSDKNYMLPVDADVPLDAVFLELPKVKVISSAQLENFARQQVQLLKSWSAHRQ